MSAARDRLCPLMWILNGEHQTTNLGVGSSDLSGRANIINNLRGISQPAHCFFPLGAQLGAHDERLAPATTHPLAASIRN